MTRLPSAATLAADLAAGRTTSLALTRAALDRIEAANPSAHIFIAVTRATAVAEAEASDTRRSMGSALGALDGIPMAVKDNIDTAGNPTTAGIGAFRNRMAHTDASVVGRLRAAGCVLLGKLNMHEGALGATTDNAAFGRCANPRMPGYSPGGSSGGSGAAVAGGYVPLTLGTDTMGSVRIPAAYCGVWGLKPTRGLVGRTGLTFLSWTLDSIGPLALCAEDLALALRVMAGFDEPDPQSLSPPIGWDPAPSAIAPHRIRLGIPAAVDDVVMEPAVRSSFAQLVARARAARFQIVPLPLYGWSPSEARRAGLLVSEAECGSLIGKDIDAAHDGVTAQFRSLIAFGRKASGEKLAKAYWTLDQSLLAARRCVSVADAILMPTAPQRAFLHDAPAPATQADFTALANLAGLPAVAFPLPTPESESPNSAQLVGRPFDEGRLLGIAKTLTEIDNV